MRRSLLALSTLSFLAIPTAATAGGGCHTDSPAQEVPATTINVEHSCFAPFVATVAPGTKVTFVNGSGMAHNLAGPAIEYTELPAGATYARTFTEKGIYVFGCTIHAGMNGAVIVRDATPAVQPVAAVDDAGKGAGNGATGWAVAGAAGVAVVVAGVVLARRKGARVAVPVGG